uniref:Uncharacterized protein n=1 Tax=Phenylobacterium glaciei TaxID=2803784 RepID=A0A974SA04_9CAUL|nr:hypothetical protein JKL49_10505 [Phenylobacterium glaciei]
MTTIDEERQRLDRIAAESLYGAGANRATIAHSFKVFERYIRPGPVLEMGPAEGHMTGDLVSTNQPLTVVEGAAFFCDSCGRGSRPPRWCIPCSRTTPRPRPSRPSSWATCWSMWTIR